MQHTAATLLVLLALAMPARASAATAPALESAQQSWLIDQTRSQLGGEFFRAFAAVWRREAHGALVISVEEQMGRHFAHQITIRVGSRTLLQTQLYASQRGRIAGIAEATAAQAAARLGNWQAQTGEIL
jgi:hypothetical protein